MCDIVNDLIIWFRTAYLLHVVCASFCRDSMATFENLSETFPDESCVLTNRELLVEVRQKMCCNRLD